MCESGIYCITNIISNKKYIGQSKNLNKRKGEHLRSLSGNYHHNCHLQRAFNKYGANAFKFETMEECEEHLLDSKEKHYIKMLNTWNSEEGYNLRAGGDVPKLSKESKLKISETRKERIKAGKITPVKHTWTQEQKRNQSKISKQRYKDDPEIKKKISLSKATISVEDIIKIKTMLYNWEDAKTIATHTGINECKIIHIRQLDEFEYIKPKYNYRLKNLHNIKQSRQGSAVMKMYREGYTYREISLRIDLHERNVIRVIKKFKTKFDEIMRERKKRFYIDKRCRMVNRMYSNGWDKKKIAKYYSMSRGTVDKILNNEEISTRCVIWNNE